jgi:hypothetical protein
MSGHDQDPLMRVMEYERRIVEVLGKYNVRLEKIPLEALAAAMERMGNPLRDIRDILPTRY